MTDRPLSADDQTAKDAKRYEWLRERWYRIATSTYLDADGVRCVDGLTMLEGFKNIPFDPQSLDKAIDAAIEAEGPTHILAAIDRAEQDRYERDLNDALETIARG